MPAEYILPLQGTKRLHKIGNKAKNLRFLNEKGFPIPVTYVCTWDAYASYLQDEAEKIVEILKTELASELDLSKRFAVRSSANLEDGFNSSFAGQFKSVLNVQGVDEMLQAIWSIWATTQSPAVQTYLGQLGSSVQDLKMAVIIQEMVSPQVSGVAFSRNPVTGLDEVLVEAVRGSGEALVQEGVTPDRWVNKWGTWTSTPTSNNGQGIDLELPEKVVRQTKDIAKAYGRPVDLEWVYDGQEVKWVQLREITSLDIPIYSNRISREVFPGIIKPLIWSVNVPLVNGAWVELLTELIGPNDIKPESLAGYFYSRAYFNMGALGQVFELLGLPRETLELLMGIEVEGPEKPSFRPSSVAYVHLPRMLRFGLDKARFARRVDAFLPDMEEHLQAFQRKKTADLTEEQLLDEIDYLYPLAQETAYYNIVVPLLMQVYSRVLKGQLGRMNVDFESFDLTAGMQELDQFEPNVHLDRLYQEFSALDGELQARILEGGFEQLSALPGTESLRKGIARFLEQFGHLSDSGNDFSHRPWRENPDLVLQMVVNHTPHEGDTTSKIKLQDLELPPMRRQLFKSAYGRARRFRWYREAVSSLYTLGYGLLRDYYLALGEHFARRGIIARKDDIFFLYMEEVREIVESESTAGDYRELVMKRKDEIDAVRDIIPPEIIFGDQAPPLKPEQEQGLKGIATSRGNYTGPARVLRGIQDMGKVQEGDVLVIPYSDVGWTPLFTKAGAVVAESGGILSHSSIVAREYGIPAVVSVTGACQLEDGTRVTVDGYRGEIVVHESTQG